MSHPIPDPTKPGQESVWAFPRPSIVQPVDAHLRVVLSGETIAETRRGVRTSETSHPPTYYFPQEDIETGALVPIAGTSFCEWKGVAVYFNVMSGDLIRPKAAWAYPDPTGPFALIRDHVAIYAAAMDACFVDCEQVVPQPGASTAAGSPHASRGHSRASPEAVTGKHPPAVNRRVEAAGGAVDLLISRRSLVRGHIGVSSVRLCRQIELVHTSARMRRNPAFATKAPFYANRSR